MEKDKVDDKDQECCEEVSIDTPTVEMYRGVMIECFDAAIVVMEQAELVTDEGYVADLQTRIAVNIFDRCTRQMPAQDKIYGLALQYVGLLMKEKEADMKRSEDVRAGGEPPYGHFISSLPPCQHERLRALREVGMCEDRLSPVGHAAINALSVNRAHHPDSYRHEDGDVIEVGELMCPDCLARVRTDMVKSGHLWTEPRNLKHGKPEGPSVSDTPLFEFELEDVQEYGNPTIYVMRGAAHDERLEDMKVADVLADPRFFETVLAEWGAGVYTFMLWKSNLTLHSDHEFILGDIQEAEEAEEAAKS